MSKQTSESWLVRHLKQNVIGASPSPHYTTWQALAVFLTWDKLNDERKKAKLARLQKEFDDETLLMDLTFRKLIGLLFVTGLIFAFGREPLGRIQGINELFIISSCLSIILVVWGLSTRLKVFRRPFDSSPSALMVDDGMGQPMHDELGAEVGGCINGGGIGTIQG